MAELPNIVGKLMASAPHAEWVTENPIIPKDVVLITSDGYITVGNGTSTYTQLEQTYDPTKRQEILDAASSATADADSASTSAALAEQHANALMLDPFVYAKGLATIDLRAVPDLPPSKTVFTRASSATRVNSRGQIESVSSGVLRTDFDPSTGEFLGWLLEGSSTNIFPYSEQFDNAVWVKAGATTSANAAVAPDGTTTADKLIEDTSADATHHAYQSSGTLVVGTSYSWSVFMKAAERTKVSLRPGTSSRFTAQGTFDLATGEATASYGTATIKKYPNGWYRCTISGVANDTTATGIAIRLLSDEGLNTYTGNGTSGIYVWGAQFEALGASTSYIPTIATAATRAADVVYMDITDTRIKEAGCLFVEGNWTPTSQNQVMAILSDQSNTNRLMIRRVSLGLGMSIVSDNTEVVSRYGELVTTKSRYAMTWGSAFNAAANGTIVGEELTNPNSPLTITRLNIGNFSIWPLYGHIQRVGIFPYTLTSSELRLITGGLI